MYNYYFKSTIEAGKGYPRLLAQDGQQSRYKIGLELSQRRTASRISQLIAVFCCLMVMLLVNINFAQAQTCPSLNCTANDVQIERVFLGDAAGDPLTSSCQPGTSQTAYLYLVISTNAPRKGVFISGTLNGQSLANCFSTELKGNSTVLEYPTPINYTCGTTLTLTDIFVAFDAGQDNFCDKKPSKDNCGVIIPSKCRRQPPIVVEAPLVANFTAQGSCTPGDEFETFTFTSTTTGGKTPYSFQYNFGDGTVITTSNTTVTHTYTTGGTKTVTLTVTDAANKTDSQIKTITVAACCQFEVTCPAPANSNLGTFSCVNIGSIPAHPANATALEASPYNIEIGDKPCGTIRFTSTDNFTPNVCSSSDQTITRTITIYDDLDGSETLNGNEPSQTCTFTYTVQADKTDPVFTSVPAGGDLGCNPTGVPEAEDATATDNCSTPTITSELGELLVDGCARSQTRTYTATDKCGNTATATQTFTWTEDTQDPVITVTGSILTSECNPSSADIETALGTATATDNCGLKSLDVTTSAIVVNGCSRSQTRTWTARDNCGNEATAIRTVTWTVDTTDPVITISGYTASLGCNPSSGDIQAALGTATATDNCGPVAVTHSDGVVVSNGCARSQTRTFTSEDACGNTATATRTVTWTEDTTDPVITATGTSLSLGCVNPTSSQLEAALGSATASDNCGNVSMNVETGTVVSNGCARSQTRTFTSEDACGNIATATRTVTWTVPLKADCFNVNLLSVAYNGTNTTFSFKVCGNNCPSALSYIAFIINKDIRVVSPANGLTYKGMHTSYKVSVPVSKNVYGVKYESLGEGIKNNCDVFTFTLAGDQRNTSIKVETKAGRNVGTVVVDPSTCICVQNNSSVARQDFSMEESLVEKGISISVSPNPFSSKTTFEFSVGESTEATLELYTIAGTKVATLHKGKLEAGRSYSVDFTPNNLGSGTYIYRLSTATQTKFGRIILTK